jgi:hypothetical protein
MRPLPDRQHWKSGHPGAATSGAQVMQAEADHDPASIQLPLGVVWSESHPLTSRRLRELRSSRFDQTTSPD